VDLPGGRTGTWLISRFLPLARLVVWSCGRAVRRYIFWVVFGVFIYLVCCFVYGYFPFFWKGVIPSVPHLLRPRESCLSVTDVVVRGKEREGERGRRVGIGSSFLFLLLLFIWGCKYSCKNRAWALSLVGENERGTVALREEWKLCLCTNYLRSEALWFSDSARYCIIFISLLIIFDVCITIFSESAFCQRPLFPAGMDIELISGRPNTRRICRSAPLLCPIPLCPLGSSVAGRRFRVMTWHSRNKYMHDVLRRFL
jgi:hypothetical protein